MTDFIDYEDGEIRMRIPSYLRQRKAGMRFFQPSRRRGKGNAIHGLVVDIVTEERAEIHRDVMATARFFDWMDVQQSLVRRGPTGHLEGGYEILSKSINTSNGDIYYRYDSIFKINNFYILTIFSGTGDIGDFEAICNEIRSSVSLSTPA